jgi:protein transport protein SEC61 subunit gamma-like protein
MDAEEDTGLVQRMKSGAKEYKRVLRVTKKPTRTEFKTIIKISGLGILLIGFIGFLIQTIYQVLM